MHKCKVKILNFVKIKFKIMILLKFQHDKIPWYSSHHSMFTIIWYDLIKCDCLISIYDTLQVAAESNHVHTNGVDHLDSSLDEAETYNHQQSEEGDDELPPQDLTKSLLAKFRSLEDVNQLPPSPQHTAQQRKVNVCCSQSEVVSCGWL